MKRIFSFAITIVFLVTLTCGCGSKDKENSQSSNSMAKESTKLESVEIAIETIIQDLDGPSIDLSSHKSGLSKSKTDNKKQNKAGSSSQSQSSNNSQHSQQSDNSQQSQQSDNSDKSQQSETADPAQQSNSTNQTQQSGSLDQSQQSDSSSQAQRSGKSEQAQQSGESNLPSKSNSQNQNTKQPSPNTSKDNLETLILQAKTNIDSLHTSWNELMPLVIKKGASSSLVNEFSSALNNLTLSLEKGDIGKVLLATNKVYSYIPDFYALIDPNSLPEIKRVRYYTRNSMLNADLKKWDDVKKDMTNLDTSWSTLKTLIPSDFQEQVIILDMSLIELNKVELMKNKELCDIKAKIALSNIESLEKNILGSNKKKTT